MEQAIYSATSITVFVRGHNHTLTGMARFLICPSISCLDMCLCAASHMRLDLQQAHCIALKRAVFSILLTLFPLKTEKQGRICRAATFFK